jgi:hypothetical protein
VSFSNESKFDEIVCGSCGVDQKECKRPTRTVGRVGKRVVSTRFGVVVAAMAITSLSQGRCQTAGEQQRRRIEEEHLG